MSVNDELVKYYKKWANEIKVVCPEFLSAEYSNPYFVSIPEQWESSKHKIMIVGEEGYGEWGCGKAEGWTIDDIEKIQNYNLQVAKKIIEKGSDRRKFWTRFIGVSNLGYPCIWNNLDKIHHLRKGKCRLNVEEEILLHSTETKILQNEIDVLKPNFIIFFGWYYEALSRELPEICKQLYPKGKLDNSLWKNSFYNIEDNGTNYIFSYHPSWRKKPTGYEQNLLNCIKSCLI